MDFVAIKDLKAPAALRERLDRSGELLVTNNGKPMALMLKVDSGEDVEPMLEIIRRARAQVALSRLRQAARKAGSHRLSSRQIAEEIGAARRAKR